jgi:hypothetical protein
MNQTKKNLICPTSPCHGCPNDTNKTGCTRKLKAGTLPGCTAWVEWAGRGWRSIHRQGMESIRERDAKRKGEKSIE